MRFLLVFTFHQFIDACRKLANSALKVIILWYNRNCRLQENLFTNKARYVI